MIYHYIRLLSATDTAPFTITSTLGKHHEPRICDPLQQKTVCNHSRQSTIDTEIAAGKVVKDPDDFPCVRACVPTCVRASQISPQSLNELQIYRLQPKSATKGWIFSYIFHLRLFRVGVTDRPLSLRFSRMRNGLACEICRK